MICAVFGSNLKDDRLALPKHVGLITRNVLCGKVSVATDAKQRKFCFVKNDPLVQARMFSQNSGVVFPRRTNCKVEESGFIAYNSAPAHGCFKRPAKGRFI